MKKILVTGAAGFIGSNLVKALLERGDHVRALDNLSQSPLSNLGPFQNHSGFEFVHADVRDVKAVREAVQGCDAVFHLAAFKIPRYDNALNTLEINSQGTRHVLEACAEFHAKAIVSSTSDCYGKNPNLPFHEGSDLWMGASTVKRWAYAVSKTFDEHLCFRLSEEKGLTFSLVRFFGGYGPNQNLTWWGGPQSVFIGCALKNEPMEVHGDGLQTRSFTYVTDHVKGLLLCLDNPKANREIFNLGNTEEITIVDLAKRIWSLAGQGEPKIKWVPYQQFGKYEDVLRRVPDVSKARRLLGFVPSVSLTEGLAKTVEWQRALTTPQETLKVAA